MRELTNHRRNNGFLRPRRNVRLLSMVLLGMAVWIPETRGLSSSSMASSSKGHNLQPTLENAANHPKPANAFSSSYVNLEGVDHYVRDTGDPSPNAPVAVLLHGLAGSTDSWEDVAPLLFAGGVRAVALDRVGFGRTERPVQPAIPFLPPPLDPPAAVKDPLVGFLESALPEPPKPPELLPQPVRDVLNQVADILPPPNQALATAVRRPSLLSPRLPWSQSDYKLDPYSSEFAVKALRALATEKLALGDGFSPRDLYFVGHSAGGPIALRAYLDALEDSYPSGLRPAGVALVAPAVLDPAEDPGIYDADEDKANDSDSDTNNLRLQVFRSVLALPDALVVPIVRRIYDGRNLTEAVLNQTAASSVDGSGGVSPERARELAAKYEKPVEEFPDDWDVGLLNVYRADFVENASTNARLRGRSLLQKVASQARKASSGNQARRPPVCVISGDADPVVPPRASRRVDELLTPSVSGYVELPGTGHLPMDETPEELARILLDFCRPQAGGGTPSS